MTAKNKKVEVHRKMDELLFSAVHRTVGAMHTPYVAPKVGNLFFSDQRRVLVGTVSAIFGVLGQRREFRYGA